MDEADEELAQLGAERDVKPQHDPPLPLDPQRERAEKLLRLKPCRTFRTDLQHKLEIIIRGQGGYWRGGAARTAKLLRTTRRNLLRWRGGYTWPEGRFLDWIDVCYREALDKLIESVCTHKPRSGRPKKIDLQAA